MADKQAKTRKDDLRIGAPFWLHTPGIAVSAGRSLGTDRADVIVVGSGISGALMAEALTAAGKSVIILDRRPPARGSTPASTAMIQHEIDIPLTRLQRKIGAQADAAWRRSVRAVQDLVTLVGDLGIDCAMQPKPALYLAGNQMGARALKTEAEARAKIGIDAEYLTRAALRDRFGMDRAAAILSPASASANPAQLTAGLLRVAQSRGARIVSPVEITDMAELPGGGVALASGDGRVLVAGHAVFCTGYEYLPQMKSKAHHVTSTWALASEPLTGLPDWMADTIVWEAAEPYLYFRTDAAGRIIAGGEDEDAATPNSDPARLRAKAKVIAAKLKALTGVDIGTPAYRWAAPFSVTNDGLPIIDRVPGFDRIHALMGFGGNGITFSMIGAQITLAAITGTPDPDAAIFAYR